MIRRNPRRAPRPRRLFRARSQIIASNALCYFIV
jgi:hypothetical protein